MKDRSFEKTSGFGRCFRVLVSVALWIAANEPAEDTWYRVGVPVETATYELTGLTYAGSVATLEEVTDALDDPGLTDISYETEATSGLERRLLSKRQTLYYGV